jgi:Tfp pilus assembly protein FimV|tara:strand:+ start:1930 stop:2367 length:438 start_codon:yes stop_codon:yes gene_type:complete
MTNLNRVAMSLLILLGMPIGLLQANTLDAERALKHLLADVDKMEADFSISAKMSPATHYTTQYGDTLDEILIKHVGKMPIRKDILKRVVVHANPNAFKRSNPNWMFSGRKLKLPDADDIRNLIFTDEAKKKMLQGRNRDDWIRYP